MQLTTGKRRADLQGSDSTGLILYGLQYGSAVEVVDSEVENEEELIQFLRTPSSCNNRCSFIHLD